MRRAAKVGLCCWLLAATSAAVAAEPVLARLDPPGARIGSAVRLHLIGAGLDGELEIRSDIPGAFTPLTPEGAGDRRRSYLLEIDEDARGGLYALRVNSAAGMSNLLLFSVGSFEEVVEAEAQLAEHLPANDTPQFAQKISADRSVNATLVGADRDTYVIRGDAGERIDIEVEARRIGSAIDPVIEVRDAAGELLARNNDAPGIRADARLSLKFPASGDYFVSVHDARFSEQRVNFYRLRVGRFDYADAIFPLGWKRGEALEVEFLGGNLDKPRRVMVSPQSAGESALVGLDGESVSLPLTFALSDGEEVLESAAQGRLREAVTVNGRIAAAGETDRYALEVEAGARWLIETRAGELGTSALYPLLTLYDQDGKKLASAGDEEPEEPLSNLASSGDAGDPYLSIEIPEGVTRLEVAVEDLLGRGGPGYAYRLVAKRQPLDFKLSLSTPQVNIPADGSALVSVTLDRRGYLGAVRLEVPNLPPGVELEGGHIAAEAGGMTTSRTSRSGVLMLRGSSDAEPADFELEVVGVGRLDDGTEIRRSAGAPGVIVGVAGRRQAAVTAPWLGSALPARLSPPEVATINAPASRQVRLIQGMSHQIEWEFEARKRGVRPSDAVNVSNVPAVGNLRIIGGAKITKGQMKGVFDLNTTMGTPPMTFDLYLSAETMDDGRRQTIYSPALTFEIVQGYAIEAPQGEIAITPGGRAVVAGRFSREPQFQNPVTVKASNLPLGVDCSEATLEADGQAYRLECSATEAAEPGEYEFEIAASSFLASEGMEAVPYSIAPVAATMRLGRKGLQ